MKTQNENINFLLSKVFTIGLFVFVLFLFKSNNCNPANSTHEPVTIAHILALDNSSVLVEPLSFQHIENSIVSCDLFKFNTISRENFQIICSHKTNQLIQLSTERYLEFKSLNIYLNPPHIRASLNAGEIPLIS